VSAEVIAWWTKATGPSWPVLRQDALALLDEAGRAEATARRVGSETLPERQQWLLETARLFEDGFLRQNALDPADAHCSPMRQYRLLALLLRTYRRGLAALERGATTRALAALPVLPLIARAKSTIGDDRLAEFDTLDAALDAQCASVESHVADNGPRTSVGAYV
jgi:V/A-type H+-transporting ATPase subunit A